MMKKGICHAGTGDVPLDREFVTAKEMFLLINNHLHSDNASGLDMCKQIKL